MLQTKLLQWFYKELHLFSRIAAASLLFCFFFSSSNIKALTVDKGSYIGKYVYIYEDSEGSVPHTDILDKKFTKSSFKIPSFGYTSSVIWVDLNLRTLVRKKLCHNFYPGVSEPCGKLPVPLINFLPIP